MGSAEVVVTEPSGQGSTTLAGAGIGPNVGPLAQQGLDEALGLAIGLRSIGPGPQVSHALGGAVGAKDLRDVRRSIVRQDATDADPALSEPRQRPLQERRGGDPELVRK